MQRFVSECRCRCRTETHNHCASARFHSIIYACVRALVFLAKIILITFANTAVPQCIETGAIMQNMPFLLFLHAYFIRCHSCDWISSKRVSTTKRFSPTILSWLNILHRLNTFFILSSFSMFSPCFGCEHFLCISIPFVPFNIRKIHSLFSLSAAILIYSMEQSS